MWPAEETPVSILELKYYIFGAHDDDDGGANSGGGGLVTRENKVEGTARLPPGTVLNSGTIWTVCGVMKGWGFFLVFSSVAAIAGVSGRRNGWGTAVTSREI